MYHIRINKVPVMARGGETKGVRTVLPEAHPMMANIEAERGETVWGPFSGNGMGEHFRVGGQRHAQGGTPLQVPDGSFIFSDTMKLKIGGPVLQEFGKGNKSKKKYTPAQLAKQYDINRYKAILQNPDSDRLEQETAGLMASNYTNKLAKLALLQEGMKGFPQGIPSVAMPLLQRMGVGSQQSGVGSQEPGEGSFDELGPTGLPMAQDGYWMRPHLQGQSPWDLPVVSVQRPSFIAQQPWDVPLQPQQALSAMSAYAASPTKRTASPAAAAKSRPLYDYDFVPNVYGNVVYPQYLPGDHKANVPWVQHKRNDGLYGDQGWDMSDFYQRHPWVQQMRANFNPANPNDVNWFQNEYNQRYSNLWGRNYFDGTGHRKVDSKFGQGTYSTPSVVEQKEPDFTPSTYKVPLHKFERGTVDAKVVPQTLNVPPNNNTFLNWKRRGNNDMRWWKQDKFNTGASLVDYFDLQQINPTLVSPNVVLPNVSLLDPARQVAASQEAANSQNLMAGMFAGPQRLRAVTSNIQGQNVPNVGNILAQVQNSNVGQVNAKEMANAQTVNVNELQRKAALSNYFDQWATARQQFIDSKAQARQNIRNNIVSGMTNADKRNWTNMINPFFNVDSNGRIAFTNNGKGIKSDAVGSNVGNPLSLMQTYLNQYNSMFPARANTEHAYAFAEKMALGNKSRYGVDSDGDETMSMSGYLPSPQAQALLNMYGRR